MKKTSTCKDVYGPWALVAGASEGLGAAFASELAVRGYNLVLIARRKDILESLAVQLEKAHGVEALSFSLDLGDTAGLKKFLSSLKMEIGLVVYNAAFAPVGSFLLMKEEELIKVTDVNIKAPLLFASVLGKAMAKRGRGGILLMSSLAGFQGSPGISAYSASKAFNTVLAQGLWAELGKAGVHVTACCAGAVRTPGYLQTRTGKDAPGTLDASVVAAEALNHLGKGPVYIPGRLNRFFHVILSRLIPLKSTIKIMERNTRSLT